MKSTLVLCSIKLLINIVYDMWTRTISPVLSKRINLGQNDVFNCKKLTILCYHSKVEKAPFWWRIYVLSLISFCCFTYFLKNKIWFRFIMQRHWRKKRKIRKKTNEMDVAPCNIIFFDQIIQMKYTFTKRDVQLTTYPDPVKKIYWNFCKREISEVPQLLCGTISTYWFIDLTNFIRLLFAIAKFIW
jgi:hypothetical protein